MPSNKMLIDASHPEETRVALVRGNRVEDFDFESQAKKQLRGNIYLAKVTRVEPSLQAAFIDYGGNRHGFLAFNEIHPDYYQIPFADRQALLAEEAEEDEEERPRRTRKGGRGEHAARGRQASPEGADDADGERDPSSAGDSARRGSGEPDAFEEDGEDASPDSGDDYDGVDDDDLDAGEDGDDIDEGEDEDEDRDDGDDADETGNPPRSIAAAIETDSISEEPDEEGESPAEPAAAEKRPRARRKSRRTTAKTAEATEAPETPEASDPGADEPAPAEAPEQTPEPFVEIDEDMAPVVEPLVESGVEPLAAEGDEDDSEPEGEDAPRSATAESGEDGRRSRRRRRGRRGGRPTRGEDEAAPAEAGQGRRSAETGEARRQAETTDDGVETIGEGGVEDEHIESVGQEDALEEVPVRRRPRRQYKIQEVIKRRQIMLVQVVKEERGNKGAALTTYLSLAGRYCVLMPNTARGGGISRKITTAADRKRLREIAEDLDVPQGMGVILRTAGANRNKQEIKRDFEYLLRLWENVRSLTLSSTAPCLVYEEGSLIKRSIRDLYDKDTGEIVVAGEAGYREAKDFMRMLMPSHARNVKLYGEEMGMFARHGVEQQLDKLLTPEVNLKSGGYLVINQTEALVAIDVNSGRSTREHSIEETALQTNLEAADEVARQLRLRDLAGLIVIDFIDMEEKRNNRSVEKRLKDALKNDRARIQVGRISHFGLLEMSRQRIRSSVIESTMDVCPHCGGLGHVRSAGSMGLHLLRAVEEHLSRHPRHDVRVRAPMQVALHVLNAKRAGLGELEDRFGVRIQINAEAGMQGQQFAVEKGEPATGTPRKPSAPPPADGLEDELDEEFVDADAIEGDEPELELAEADEPAFEAEVEVEPTAEAAETAESGERGDARGRRRRRGRRGGRRARSDEDGVADRADDEAEGDAGSPVDVAAQPDEEGEDSSDAGHPAEDESPAGFETAPAGAGTTLRAEDEDREERPEDRRSSGRAAPAARAAAVESTPATSDVPSEPAEPASSVEAVSSRNRRMTRRPSSGTADGTAAEVARSAPDTSEPTEEPAPASAAQAAEPQTGTGTGTDGETAGSSRKGWWRRGFL